MACASMHSCTHASSQHPARLDLVQSGLGAWWTELQRPNSLPSRTHPPRPSPGGAAENQPAARRCWLLTRSSVGAGRPRSPPSRAQSLLRMCACSCVCIFIRLSLFRTQPSAWGSWTLHVRVSPKPSPAAPPRALPRPAPSSAGVAAPAEKRIMGNSRTLPTHPSACLLGLPACLPQSPGAPISISFPLLTREERVPNHARLCGLACTLGFAAGRPGLPAAHWCLLCSFRPQRVLESSAYPRLFP